MRHLRIKGLAGLQIGPCPLLPAPNALTRKRQDVVPCVESGTDASYAHCNRQPKIVVDAIEEQDVKGASTRRPG